MHVGAILMSVSTIVDLNTRLPRRLDPDKQHAPSGAVEMRQLLPAIMARPTSTHAVQSGLPVEGASRVTTPKICFVISRYMGYIYLIEFPVCPYALRHERHRGRTSRDPVRDYLRTPLRRSSHRIR